MRVERDRYALTRATARPTQHLASRAGLIFFILLCLTLAPGCTVWQLAKRTAYYEPRSYTLEPEECRDIELYRSWARDAWAESSFDCPDSIMPGHYEEGFEDGFVDFVFAGGTGEPPPIPPRRYWRLDYRNDFGQQTIDSWNAGFRHGARVAMEGGYRQRAVVPARFPANMQRARGVFGPLPPGVESAEEPTANILDDRNHFPSPGFDDDENRLPPDALSPAGSQSRSTNDESNDNRAGASGSGTRNKFAPQRNQPNRAAPIRRQPEREERQSVPGKLELDDGSFDLDDGSLGSQSLEPSPPMESQSQPDRRLPPQSTEEGPGVDELDLFEDPPSDPDLDLGTPSNGNDSELGDFPKFDDGARREMPVPNNSDGFFGQSMVADVPAPPLKIDRSRRPTIRRATYLNDEQPQPVKTPNGFYGESLENE